MFSFRPTYAGFVIGPSLLSTHINSDLPPNVGYGTALHAGRSRVRFPVKSLRFFIGLILPAALWPYDPGVDLYLRRVVRRALRRADWLKILGASTSWIPRGFTFTCYCIMRFGKPNTSTAQPSQLNASTLLGSYETGTRGSRTIWSVFLVFVCLLKIRAWVCRSPRRYQYS